MKTNYQVTIGYKAIITVNVKAENEADAKKQALEILSKEKTKMYDRRNSKLQLEDDNFAADGVLNMDNTWNQF